MVSAGLLGVRAKTLSGPGGSCGRRRSWTACRWDACRALEVRARGCAHKVRNLLLAVTPKALRISPTIYVAAKRSKEHRRASSRRRRRSRMVRSAAAGRRRRWSCPHTETQALAKTAFSLGGVPGALKASGWGGGAVFVICCVSGESTREYKGARHVARACIASPGPARSCPRPPWEE